MQDDSQTGDGSQRGQRTRQMIYEEALRLFETKGFRGTSMRDIAAACGVTKPALYYHFESKSQLLAKLYEDITAKFFEDVREIAAARDSAESNLRRLVVTQSIYNINNRRFLRIFWNERHELEGEARAALARLEREFEATVQSLVERGQAEGVFAAAAPKVVTYAVLGLLSTVHRWALYTGRPPEAVAEHIADLVLGGVIRRGDG